MKQKFFPWVNVINYLVYVQLSCIHKLKQMTQRYTFETPALVNLESL
jgi:hypothetical protein